MALGSTQPLTEMSTRNFPGVKSGRRVGLTNLPPSMSRLSENVGASTSCKPKGLHGLYKENFYFYLYRELSCHALRDLFTAVILKHQAVEDEVTVFHSIIIHEYLRHLKRDDVCVLICVILT
jgi:hypothetical protein